MSHLKKGAAFIPKFGRLKDQNLQIFRLSTPCKIQRLQSNVMEVDGKWCSFPIGWFLGSMLIFRVALNCIVWIVLDSEKKTASGIELHHIFRIEISQWQRNSRHVSLVSFRPASGHIYQQLEIFSEGCMTAWQEHCMVELLYISYKAFQSLSKTMKNHEKQRIFRFYL